MRAFGANSSARRGCPAFQGAESSQDQREVGRQPESPGVLLADGLQPGAGPGGFRIAHTDYVAIPSARAGRNCASSNALHAVPERTLQSKCTQAVSCYAHSCSLTQTPSSKVVDRCPANKALLPQAVQLASSFHLFALLREHLLSLKPVLKLSGSWVLQSMRYSMIRKRK